MNRLQQFLVNKAVNRQTKGKSAEEVATMITELLDKIPGTHRRQVVRLVTREIRKDITKRLRKESADDVRVDYNTSAAWEKLRTALGLDRRWITELVTGLVHE